MRGFRSFVVPIAIGVLLACGKPKPAPAFCQPLWKAGRTTRDAAATIAGGVLTMNAPARMSGQSLYMSQDGLAGDFDLTIDYEALSLPQGSGVDFDLRQSSPAGKSFLSATLSPGNLEVRDGVENRQVDQRNIASTATAGVVEFSRTGDMVTATMLADGKSVELTFPLGTGTLLLSFSVFASNTMAASQVHIDDIAVTGSTGTFKGDTFDCNTLPGNY
jgi:hypothetical protein